MKNTLIFMHIPKCGGTTVNRALVLKISSLYELTRRMANTRQRYKANDLTSIVHDFNVRNCLSERLAYFCHGHYAYGVHENLNGKAHYITALRNPIDLVVSMYNFGSPQDEDGNLLSMKAFMQNGCKNSVRLHGYCIPDNIMLRALAGEHGFYPRVPIGSCTEEMYEKAIDRLNNNFISTVILERFDQSLLCLCRKMGWKYLLYSISNVNTKKNRVLSFDDETIKLILERNAFDIRLYDYMNNVLDKEISDYGNKFSRDLKRQHFINKIFSQILVPINHLFSKLRSTR